MSENRILLDAAAFLDSPRAAALAVAARPDVRTVVHRFLRVCYQDLGKVPRLLDGEEMGRAVAEHLPRRFGVRDPLAEIAEPVLEAYLAFLDETQVVTAAFEQRQALSDHAPAFREAVASGAAHRDGVAVFAGRTIVHRADKTGRNDPCPCGSGKKFKKCCMPLRGEP